MRTHLTVEQRQLALRLRAKGLSLREIGPQVGCSYQGVALIVRRASQRPVRADGWVPGPGRLTLAGREEITWACMPGSRSPRSRAGWARRSRPCRGRWPPTAAGTATGRGGRISVPASRPGGLRACKLARPELAAQVTSWLREWWSPVQISRRLRIEFPDDPMMQVSHETIYQSLYVQGRGELRRELARCLRSGRAKRRPRGRDGRSGHIKDMVMISERPAEVEDRAVPGHWEGDLIIGKDCTIRDRHPGRADHPLRAAAAPARTAATRTWPAQAMREAIGTLPAELARTITWDQGIEMACHADFTIATGIPVYFCDPHSPWQRGSNENTNGLLRQYLPKGTDLSVHSAGDLARIARSLNGRPRKTLGFMTPSEKLAELLAHTG